MQVSGRNTLLEHISYPCYAQLNAIKPTDKATVWLTWTWGSDISVELDILHTQSLKMLLYFTKLPAFSDPLCLPKTEEYSTEM